MDKLIERFDALRNGGNASIDTIKKLIDEELLTKENYYDFFEEYDEYFDFHYRRNDEDDILYTLPLENVTVIFEDGCDYWDGTLAQYLTDDGGIEYYEVTDLQRAINHAFGQDILRKLKWDGTFDDLAKEIVIGYKEKKEIEDLKERIDDDRDRYEIQGEDYFYDSEENIFIDIDNDVVVYRTLEEELNEWDFLYVNKDEDYADSIIDFIKDNYEGTARHDLLSFACDKYNKDFFKVNDRW